MSHLEDLGPCSSAGRVVSYESGTARTVLHDIDPHQSLLIGRSKSCDLIFDDLTVSNKHLRIYCILYTDDCSARHLVFAEDMSCNGSYWNGSYMGKASGGFLLSDGDEIRLSPHVKVRVELTMLESTRLDGDLKNESQKFKDQYVISDRILGSGGQGQVFMALNRTQARQVACKVIDINKMYNDDYQRWIDFDKRRDKGLDNMYTTWALGSLVQDRGNKKQQEFLRRIHQEFAILKGLRHPNIVRSEKAYAGHCGLWIFQELLPGGDLLSYIERKGGRLDEAEAALVVRQILEAVKYLHDKGIAHRDLKPENIMVGSLAEGARIVLTDFGNAKEVLPNSDKAFPRMNTAAGTFGYIAPEVFGFNSAVKEAGYTMAVDMWAIGCITAAALTGELPLALPENGKNKPLSEQQVDESLNDPRWESISARPKDFVRKLLVLDERHRMTASEALQHHWFTNEHVKDTFDRAYRRAISACKDRVIPAPELEGINGFPECDLRKSDPSKMGKTKRKPKKPEIPVELHHHPYSKIMQQTLFAPKGRKRPNIAAVSEIWEQNTARLLYSQGKDDYCYPIQNPTTYVLEDMSSERHLLNGTSTRQSESDIAEHVDQQQLSQEVVQGTRGEVPISSLQIQEPIKASKVDRVGIGKRLALDDPMEIDFDLLMSR